MTYSSVVLADSPLVYWRLGEASGTTATDASGNGKHGTIAGSPTFGTTGALLGDANTAITFDGVNDAVTVADTTDLTAWSVEVWIKTSASSGTVDIANRYGAGGNEDLFQLRLVSGAPRIRCYHLGGVLDVTGPSSIANGQWHHVVGTFVSATGVGRVYVDGAQVATATGTPGSNIKTGNAPFSIGGFVAFGANWFPGVIDEAAYYTSALSAARVLAHFNGASPADQNITPGFAASDGTAYAVTLSQPTVVVSEVERPVPGRRLYPAPQIRVGGMWLSTIAGWGDLEVKHGRNGPFEATWNMALGDTERPSPLIRNARVEIYAGPTMVWCGALGQPDWDAKSFAAIGIARQAEGAECMTSGGAITSKPNTAIDQAAARDVVWWTRAGDFGNTDIAGVPGDASNDDPDPGKLTDLLDLWARENDSQWRVTADGRLVIDPEDETEPDWLILPGAGVLGEADDDVADRVFIRYNDSTAGKIRYASYPASTPANGIERRGSVVKRGPMSASRALAIATGMYRQAQAGRIGWTNGIEVTDQQIITKGGHPANLALIRAGQTVRMLDTPDPRNGGRNLDFVIGESTWRPVERTVQLNPVGMVKRTWEELLADNRLEAA